MKHSLILLICLTLFISGNAQTKIDASKIIKWINEGRDVTLVNTEIKGNLDLTDLTNRVRKPKRDHFSNDDNLYISTVTVALSFTDCKFSGKVLAYYSLRCNDQGTFIANFEKDVLFKNCVFTEASEFKYSEFAQSSSFSGSTFIETANFKYAEFANGPSFDNVKFEGGANFKYTDFPKQTSFRKATFLDHADFKYSKFTSPVNLEGVVFNGHGEFKYTKLNGKHFGDFQDRD